jgi:hypothetical protein
MAGILDSKQRIMDVIITKNGRRQIADGTFDIKYASFSDHGIFYRDDGTGVTDNADERIMFESFASNGDVIIPEINNVAAISMNTSNGKKVVNGVIYGSGSYVQTGSIDVYSSSADIIQTAVEHFDKLQIIGSDDKFLNEKIYRLFPSSIEFDYPPQSIRKLSTLRPIYLDKNLTSHNNFKYLPPVYELNSEFRPMAAYSKLTGEPHTTIDTIKDELEEDHEIEEVKIVHSDEIVNLLCQCFEITAKRINKLSIIDYGAYLNEKGEVAGHVFHLGKVLRDEQSTPKFIKIMTVIFE